MQGQPCRLGTERQPHSRLPHAGAPQPGRSSPPGCRVHLCPCEPPQASRPGPAWPRYLAPARRHARQQARHRTCTDGAAASGAEHKQELGGQSLAGQLGGGACASATAGRAGAVTAAGALARELSLSACAFMASVFSVSGVLLIRVLDDAGQTRCFAFELCMQHNCC